MLMQQLEFKKKVHRMAKRFEEFISCNVLKISKEVMLASWGFWEKFIITQS